MGLGI
ncbi:rCG61157 [Rattus norvegicus]